MIEWHKEYPFMEHVRVLGVRRSYSVLASCFASVSQTFFKVGYFNRLVVFHKLGSALWSYVFYYVERGDRPEELVPMWIGI